MEAATSAGMDADHREEMTAAGLSLGLIYGIGKGDRSAGKIFQLDRCASTATSIEPALTLGLPGDRQESEKAGTTADGGDACPTSRGPVLGRRPSSSDHRLSRVKTGNSGKASPSGGSDGEEYGRTRKKLRLSKEQSALLEDKFKEQTTLTTKQKQTLARQLKLRPRQVEVWFQNRRARTKLKKTEAECELLRKFYDGLREENKRLQKELQVLKSLKFASASRYMQTPSSATAICSSCKKLSSRAGGDDEQGGSFLGYSAKLRFFNPSAHQSEGS